MRGEGSGSLWVRGHKKNGFSFIFHWETERSVLALIIREMINVNKSDGWREDHNKTILK